MNQIVPIRTDRTDQGHQRSALSKKLLAVDGAQFLFGAAYDRVIKDHPDITDESQRFDRAVVLALNSVYGVISHLNNEISRATDLKQDNN